MPHPAELDDARAWLRLSLEPGVGPATIRELLSVFAWPQNIFAASAKVLRSYLSSALAQQLSQPPTAEISSTIERTLNWLAHEDYHLLTWADSSYPQALLTTHDPPPVLYVVGDLACLNLPAVAVVGARQATPAGSANAQAFSESLANQGWIVVSGLAWGIDGAAHRGALACPSGQTIAVIGTGADIVYPARHKSLAHDIARRGAIVSEFPLGAAALAHHFPRRNRIIAGLARGVLVVEAAPHSGSLITARLATEIGREVFAIPGSIHAPLARGCHALIKQGAKLVETAQDIIEELGPLKTSVPTKVNADGPDLLRPPLGSDLSGLSLQEAADTQTAATTSAEIPFVSEGTGFADEDCGMQCKAQNVDGSLTPSRLCNAAMRPQDRSQDRIFGYKGYVPAIVSAEHTILHALGHEIQTIEELSALVGLSIAEVSAELLLLEMAGRVARLPGGQYQRLD